MSNDEQRTRLWSLQTSVNKLVLGGRRDPEKIANILQVIVSGSVVSSFDNHLINCDTDPFCPDGWTVEEHRKGGQLNFDSAKIRLHLSSGQMNGRRIEGNKLRKELAKMPVMNANVLDCWLAHPELIQKSLKVDENGNPRYICFWGTIYRLSGGILCVRFLYWLEGRWRWVYSWLDFDFDDNYPAAVLASSS